MMGPLSILLLSSVLIRTVIADFAVLEPGFIANSSAVTLSTACVNALQSSVTCDQYLQDNAYVDTYGPLNASLLDTFCTTGCSSSLISYRKNVVSACAKDPQPFTGIPAQYFVDVIWAQYNFTCLKDPGTGQYCNSYFTTLAASLPADTSMASLPVAQVCSPCILALGRQMQATSYSNYNDAIATEWSTIQTKCGVKYPTAVPPLQTNATEFSGFASPGTPASTTCLSGNTYTVVSGDDCIKISSLKKVSTGALIVLNQLFPDCSNLLGGQSLCLPQTCSTVVVKAGQTCYGIANAAGITYTQLLSWNPTINGQCTNLIANQNICISQPGAAYTATLIPGATVTKTSPYASATVAAPGSTAHGTTTHCGKYYKVQTGDDCQVVALNNTIVLSLFQQINPDINAGCTNLVPGLYYCVEPTADWNNTSPSSSITSSLVTAPAPTPSGTTSNCYEWHTVVSGDYCSLVESSYGISFAQFQFWNPNINAACSNLLLGDAYCVHGAAPAPTGQPG